MVSAAAVFASHVGIGGLNNQLSPRSHVKGGSSGHNIFQSVPESPHVS